jgi:hypothetical protein
MSQNWIINASGRTFGPYTASQMAGFAVEGRLASSSLVARTTQSQFRPASEDPEIAAMLNAVRTAVASKAGRVSANDSSSGKSDADRSVSNRIVIVAELKSGSVRALERAMLDLGPAYPIASRAWLLSTGLSVAAVRNLLVQTLGRFDQLFVVDATNQKLAWTNYAPEAEVKLRRIWMGDAKTSIAA